MRLPLEVLYSHFFSSREVIREKRILAVAEGIGTHRSGPYYCSQGSLLKPLLACQSAERPLKIFFGQRRVEQTNVESFVATDSHVAQA